MCKNKKVLAGSLLISLLSLGVVYAGEQVKSTTSPGLKAGRVGAIRSPATNNESHDRKDQIGHYDHQHDSDEVMEYTLGQCQVCLGDVTDKDMASHKAYACSENHCVDTHCLSHKVKSLEIHTLEQVKELRSHGLPCCGEGGKCKDRIALDTVEDLLDGADREALIQRLTKIEKSAKSGLDERAEKEIIHLSLGIEGAFNLCCPAAGCGGVLDKIEGCNAATCSDETCKATFCYLCLKPQANSQAAHAHARDHSNNYWEMRPGFTERYHWQISRKELGITLKGRIDPKVRNSALEAHKSLLEEKNMWPMPAGMKTAVWAKGVLDTPESSRKYYVFENAGKNRIEKTEQLHTKEKKIELLQNEYIFLTHEKDNKNADIVKSALKSMGGQAFASLDVRDAGQPVVAVAADRGQAPNIQPQVGRQQPAAAPLNPNEQLEPVVGADQVQVFIRLGEEQYRVGNLIWSSAAHEEAGARAGRVKYMDWHAADRFCRELGDRARLPTRKEYEALGRAMGRPDNYRPDRIADMRINWFWSSSPVPASPHVYVFKGDYGSIEFNFTRKDNDNGSVRCVRLAERG